MERGKEEGGGTVMMSHPVPLHSRPSGQAAWEGGWEREREEEEVDRFNASHSTFAHGTSIHDLLFDFQSHSI